METRVHQPMRQQVRSPRVVVVIVVRVPVVRMVVGQRDAVTARYLRKLAVPEPVIRIPLAPASRVSENNQWGVPKNFRTTSNLCEGELRRKGIVNKTFKDIGRYSR